MIIGKRPVDDLKQMYYIQLDDLEKMAREKHFEDWLKKLKT